MTWPVLACALALAPTPRVAQRTGVLPALGSSTVVGRTIDTSWLAPRSPGLFQRDHAFGPGGGPLFPGTATAAAPANCDLAVGPNEIVQVVNGKIAYFSKAGALLFEQDSAAFFAGLAQTPSPQEPRAVYDELAGRFIVLFVENDVAAEVSNVLLAVSDDADPAGAWHQYRFDCVRVQIPDKYWMERPGLGYNSEGICITGTHFAYGTGDGGGSSFFVIQKPPLLVGGPIVVDRILDTANEYAQVCGSDSAPVPYIFGATQIAANKVRVYRVQDVSNSSPEIHFVDASALSAPMPPTTAPSTEGALLETQTNRVISVAWRADRLLVASNSLAGASMSGVRWHIFNSENFASDSVPIVATSLVSSASVNYFMPACGLNKWGDAALVFTGSSSSVTSDFLGAGRVATDFGTFMSAPFALAAASGSPYTDTRWGRYFGMALDPADGETFWGTAMAVSSSGWWETHVVPFTVSKTWPLAPSSFTWIRGVFQSGTLGSLASDDGDYNVAKAGLVLFPSEPPAQIVVSSVAPEGQVLGFSLSVVAKVNTPGLSQRVELWNWASGAYVSVGAVGATTSDSVQVVSAPGVLSDFVEPGTRAVRTKVSWFRSGLTLVWPWTVSVDQVEWRVRAR